MTYATDEDVQNRLDLDDQVLDQRSPQIENCRERSFRWIKHQFARRGKEHPDPNSLDAQEEILIDIEADLSAYYYRRDQAEFTDEEKGYKVLQWKKDAEEKLEDYLRSNYAETYYGIGGES